MHPLHERYSRTPPSNKLNELFDLLDHLDYDVRDELLLLVSEVVEPYIDPSWLAHDPIDVVFRHACKRLSGPLAEEVVVRHIISTALWHLVHQSDCLHDRHRTSQEVQHDRQLPLFANADVLPENGQSKDQCTIYETFCTHVVHGLFEGRATNSPSHTSEEDIAFLALCEMRGVGYWTILKLVRNGLLRSLFHLNSKDDFFRHLRAAGAKLPTDSISDGDQWRANLLDRGYRLLERLAAQNIAFIPQASSAFPSRLREIPDPPLWLFVQGNAALLSQRSVAVVGTRQPTPDGMALARMVGECLPEFQSAIVSGLAEGIDQVMHRSAIERFVPTIAVLGTGIFSNYPSGSEDIREQICAEGGAVITEYLPRDSYSAKNFVRRNRIQAGLATVVIPVEWRERSGTAHTVRFAYEAKRRIVCARLSHWNIESHSELEAAEKMGADIFTLPDEQPEFIRAVGPHKGK